MKKIQRFLVVNASGETRLMKTRPRLGWNEVAFQVNVTIPDAWASIRGSIDITMPDPPDALLDVELLPEAGGTSNG